MAMVLANDETDYSIKPQNSTPALDTSSWPLLLKGYSDRKTLHLWLLEALQLINASSAHSNRAFHAHSVWLHSTEARPEILHQLRCDQP